ncbi:neo-calmodulin-like [Dreissena polymorpha]|uniref:EF-hand domain-containing protein n=1 Tax=Dreissena polymorpha TaxID=45954 RepID=A0A9D4E7T0_DREPO|nr:neo-calmodulin-like [Dreissena polymorpha]KAH3774328.1 hypothetical protein DPMN_175707 [Dreissena polymorpha]
MDAFKALRRKFVNSNASSSKTTTTTSSSSSSVQVISEKVSRIHVQTKKDVQTQNDVNTVSVGAKPAVYEKPNVELKTQKEKPPVAKKPIHQTVENGLVQADRDRKSSISDEKLQELHETFVLFDKNGDGMITKEELGAVLYALGQRPTVMEVQALIRSVDLDQSGTIDFDEFVTIFSAKLAIDPEQELHEVFDIFDLNSDGFISAEELFEMLQKLGEHITRSEADKMINEADINRDGKVDYKEFKAILNAR